VTVPDEENQEQHRSLRFGWASLFLWAFLGLGLEGAQGFKLSPYLDDDMARMLLRLAHAHGVGLSLVVLVYGWAGAPLFSTKPDGGRSVGTALRAGAVLLPLGFLLSVIGHSETDPGIGILLSPIGAVALLVGLGRVAWAALRA
jgi:hypothetical protein